MLRPKAVGNTKLQDTISLKTPTSSEATLSIQASTHATPKNEIRQNTPHSRQQDALPFQCDWACTQRKAAHDDNPSMVRRIVTAFSGPRASRLVQCGGHKKVCLSLHKQWTIANGQQQLLAFRLRGLRLADVQGRWGAESRCCKRKCRVERAGPKAESELRKYD